MRLDRSLQGLVTFLGEMNAKGMDLYLHRQGLDTAARPLCLPARSILGGAQRLR